MSILETWIAVDHHNRCVLRERLHHILEAEAAGLLTSEQMRELLQHAIEEIPLMAH